VGWPVYSTRFLKPAGAIGATCYTVPAGRLAVVKMITGSNPARITGVAGVLVAEKYIYIRDFQASLPFESLATMVVVYAGERIGAYVAHAELGLFVSGYLLMDVDGQVADDPPSQTKPIGKPPPPLEEP